MFINSDVTISVIIPIYNAEKFLNKCLNSIINQTYENLEIICINDGSTDNSLKILKKFSKRDCRIKVFTTDNYGQGSARNLGLNNASGDYISFIDADDWIRKDTYELLYSKINKFDLDLLFFRMINFIESTGEFIETELYNYSSLIDNFESNIPFSSSNIGDLLFNIAVCPVSKLYKKSFLDKNNIRFPENIIFEDNIFFYETFLKANSISYVDEQLYFRRRHDNSVTQNINKKSFDIVLATNKMLLLFKDNNWYDEYKYGLINHSFSMILEWFFKANIIISEDFYQFIKNNFLGFNNLKSDFLMYLHEKNRKTFNAFLSNDYYLDFISEYNYNNINYDCITSVDFNYMITVIIPIYNNEFLIHRTLLSLMHQSIGFDNIEIILIDDNSNDGTLSILKDYSRTYDNIKLIALENNTGSSGTPRNVGLYEASSDYVMFLDHDDFFDVNALEKLYIEMNNCQADVVFGTYSVIQNNKFNDIFYPKEKAGYFNSLDENERFVGFPPPSIWTKLFRKDFLIDNNIFFPTILGEDAIFMIKVFLNASGIIYLNDVIVCFHDLNEKSATNNVTLKYLSEGLVSEKYLHDYFITLDKEYLFQYRCESNLNFFLSQFLRSNLSKEEIMEILPIFRWFILKCVSFDLVPNNSNNRILFEYIINNDLNSICHFKNKLNFFKKEYFFKRFVPKKYINLLKKIVVKLKK